MRTPFAGTIAGTAVARVVSGAGAAPDRRDAPDAGKVRPAVVRARLLITVVVIVILTGVAVAVARTPKAPSLTVNETPLAAGAPTALSLRTTFDRSTHGELSDVEVDLARGFRFDARAAGVCSNAQAHAGRCPRRAPSARARARSSSRARTCRGPRTQ